MPLSRLAGLTLLAGAAVPVIGMLGAMLGVWSFSIVRTSISHRDPGVVDGLEGALSVATGGGRGGMTHGDDKMVPRMARGEEDKRMPAGLFSEANVAAYVAKGTAADLKDQPPPAFTASDKMVAYIQHSFGNNHDETFFTHVHHLCGRSAHPPPAYAPWHQAATKEIWIHRDAFRPHFKGKDGRLPPPALDSLAIWAELNNTDCPIYITDHAPASAAPAGVNVTVVTTWGRSGASKYLHPAEWTEEERLVLNNPRYILFCHDAFDQLEFLFQPKNLWFFTPYHRQWLLPAVFPYRFTSIRARRKWRGTVPVFLIQGGHTGSPKRNVHCLQRMLSPHLDRQFKLRFLGELDPFSGSIARTLCSGDQGCLDNYRPHLEGMQRATNQSQLDTHTYMHSMTDVYAIIPLVDESNFFLTYMAGRKLTSSISWGVGFNHSFVVWRPLAEFYRIKQRTFTYDHQHNNGLTGIASAFGRALDAFDAMSAAEL